MTASSASAFAPSAFRPVRGGHSNNVIVLCARNCPWCLRKVTRVIQPCRTKLLLLSEMLLAACPGPDSYHAPRPPRLTALNGCKRLPCMISILAQSHRKCVHNCFASQCALISQCTLSHLVAAGQGSTAPRKLADDNSQCHLEWSKHPPELC
jgi:hypothetical protein